MTHLQTAAAAATNGIPWVTHLQTAAAATTSGIPWVTHLQTAAAAATSGSIGAPLQWGQPLPTIQDSEVTMFEATDSYTPDPTRYESM
ncbi:hypothetical protein, partial [Bifidobacterium choerinum]|uniref:hypothetical protein n=1 Tax=Bifidobacterium choerinum TaxID=35760 RepID=UPI001B7FA49B